MNTEELNIIPEEPPSHVTAIPISVQEAPHPQDPPNSDPVTQNAEPVSAAECEEEQPPVQEAVQVDQEKKNRLMALFLELIKNPRFWAKENRVKRLEDALKLPLFDDNRAMQQYCISAREELTREAMESAIKNQVVPVMPTEEEIQKRAQEKYEAKLAKESKKKAKKTTV